MKKVNITFTADKTIIEKARIKARNHYTTLNKLFGEWLINYIKDTNVNNLYEFFDKTSYVIADRKYTREEMNER